MRQALNAVRHLHARLREIGVYVDACADCVQLYQASPDSNGCRLHCGHRQIFRSGNPRFDCDLREFMEKFNKDNSAYTPDGDNAITPKELINIWRHLLTNPKGNGWHEFQLWTMLLVGSTLFLRAEKELCGLTVCLYQDENIRIDLLLLIELYFSRYLN